MGKKYRYILSVRVQEEVDDKMCLPSHTYIFKVFILIYQSRSHLETWQAPVRLKPGGF